MSSRVGPVGLDDGLSTADRNATARETARVEWSPANALFSYYSIIPLHQPLKLRPFSFYFPLVFPLSPSLSLPVGCNYTQQLIKPQKGKFNFQIQDLDFHTLNAAAAFLLLWSDLRWFPRSHWVSFTFVFVSFIHSFSSIYVVCSPLERFLLLFYLFLDSGVKHTDPPRYIISIYVFLSVTSMALHCFVLSGWCLFFCPPSIVG